MRCYRARVPHRHKVIQTEHLSPAAATWLAERCELIVCGHDDPRFFSLLADADGLVVRTYTIVNEALLAAAPKLRVVGRAGVGLDNIDIDACRKYGIQVVSTPDANTQAVVEYITCLLGDALRPRVVLTKAVDPRTWNDLRARTVGLRQMSDLTLGVLGLGRVGRRVAEVARAIGFNVLFNDILPDLACGFAQRVSVDELFARSDVVSIHIDGRPTNRCFVSAALINRMKSDAVFINTSRGFVVDHHSLWLFMAAHPAAQALLDVHEPEPFDATYPMLGLPNVKLYPHLASRTERAMENMSWVVRDVWTVLQGKQPKFPAAAPS